MKNINTLFNHTFLIFWTSIIRTMNNKQIIFDKVTGSSNQKLILFNLLKKRKYKISHSELPSQEKHNHFVDNHPYRDWFIVKENEIEIGSFYLKFDNSVGLNLIKQSQFCVDSIINFIRINYLPEVYSESIVPTYFYINISNDNFELQNILHKLNFNKIQVSYKI